MTELLTSKLSVAADAPARLPRRVSIFSILPLSNSSSSENFLVSSRIVPRIWLIILSSSPFTVVFSDSNEPFSAFMSSAMDDNRAVWFPSMITVFGYSQRLYCILWHLTRPLEPILVLSVTFEHEFEVEFTATRAWLPLLRSATYTYACTYTYECTFAQTEFSLLSPTTWIVTWLTCTWPLRFD